MIHSKENEMDGNMEIGLVIIVQMIPTIQVQLIPLEQSNQLEKSSLPDEVSANKISSINNL